MLRVEFFNSHSDEERLNELLFPGPARYLAEDRTGAKIIMSKGGPRPPGSNCVAPDERFPMKTLIGQPAFPFFLEDSNGKVQSLDDYRGSWLLMVFHRHLG